MSLVCLFGEKKHKFFCTSFLQSFLNVKKEKRAKTDECGFYETHTINVDRRDFISFAQCLISLYNSLSQMKIKEVQVFATK